MKTKEQFFKITSLAILTIASTSLFAANGAAAGNTPAPSAGGASVVGKVKFTGQIPQPAHVSMNADPSCAKAHPGPATSQDYLTGSENSLGNVVVFISDGLGNRSFDVPTEAVTFEQKGCEYMPHVVAVRANQKLKMVNSDNTTHNIHPLPVASSAFGRGERKVRTPQSSVPDNVRGAGFKPGLRLVPQKTYRLGGKVGVRVKRCGKSAPPPQQCGGQGKPHTEQDQIGREFSFGWMRAGSARHNLRVGRLSPAVMRGPEE